MSDAIVVDHVSKTFRRSSDRPRRFSELFVRGWKLWRRPEPFRALDDVSFRLARGKMLGVIGRNGAGKSTLLRLVGGVGRPTGGRIEARGDIRALLDLGSTFHPDLTGRENVYLSGVVSGLTRQEVRERFEAIFAFAELEAFVDSPVRTYSTGMQTRLAFSVAVHTNPEILLVDEVLAVGDLGFQNKCLERVAHFKDNGCAILLVSHDTSLIEEFCDEALWLQKGRVASFGAPKKVVEEYLGELMKETRQRMPRDRAAIRASSGRELRMNETRFGSLEVEIRDVSLTDDRGGALEEIDPGDSVTVAIEYESKESVLEPRIAVTILRKDGTVCFDTTTELDGQSIGEALGRARIELHIERLDLAGGTYFVDVGIYEREWAYAYDFHHRVYPLRVRRQGSFKGVLSAPHRWRQDERSDPGSDLGKAL